MWIIIRGQTKHFKTVGAKVRDNWSAEVNNKGYNRVVQEEWDSSPTCLLCAQGNRL